MQRLSGSIWFSFYFFIFLKIVFNHKPVHVLQARAQANFPELCLLMLFLAVFVILLGSFVPSCSPLSQFVFAWQTFISILGSCAHLLC